MTCMCVQFLSRKQSQCPDWNIRGRPCRLVVKCTDTNSNPASPLPSCVTIGKSLNFSVHPFPHVKNGDYNITYLIRCCKNLMTICIVYLHIYSCCCCLSCSTLCNPMDCSPPGSSVHGILWARILEWVAISFSNLNLDLELKLDFDSVGLVGFMLFLFVYLLFLFCF